MHTVVVKYHKTLAEYLFGKPLYIDYEKKKPNTKKLVNEIGKLIILKKLDLSYNSLTVLPKTIGKLKNLEILNLKGNHIETLP